jgi:hypothetical protein
MSLVKKILAWCRPSGSSYSCPTLRLKQGVIIVEGWAQHPNFKIIFKHGTAEKRLSHTPDVDEILYVNDTGCYYRGDGFTPGGILLFKETPKENQDAVV